MELKEFIKTALVDIVKGVNESKQMLGENSDCICPFVNRYVINNEGKAKGEFDHANGLHHQVISFDIAVTTESTGTNGGKIGIKVCGLEAGVGKSADVTNASTSRIKFHVPIALKTEKINNQPEAA